MKNIKSKKRFSLVMVMIFALVLVSFSSAATESNSTGIFNVINPPENSSIKITKANTLDVPNSLVPQQDYDIRVTVINNKGIGSQNGVEVKMWLDTIGTQFRESYFNEVVALDGTNNVSITWDKNTKIPVINSGNDNTWKLSLEDCVLPSDQVLNDPTITEFEFIFSVKIGKVAKMTEGNQMWQIAFRTSDEATAVYGYYAINEKPGIKIDWYCEVQSPTEIRWGNILPGISYENENAKQKIGEVKYISNGAFNEQVKFNNVWNQVDGQVSAVLTDEALNRNEFALKVSKTDNLDLAKKIPSDGSFIMTSEQNSPTTYEGIIRTDYHLYIKLNQDFAVGKYAGNITFGISN